MSFNRVTISEDPDNAHESKQAERALNQAPSDHWDESQMRVRVDNVRDSQRVRMSADDVYVNVPDERILPFDDLESQLQAQESLLYRSSAAYRDVVDRRILKTGR
jgi:hypothetical protein